MREDLARTLDELRARASEDGLQPEGVEQVLETIHADEHAGAHLDGFAIGGGGTRYELPDNSAARHRMWMKRNPP